MYRRKPKLAPKVIPDFPADLKALGLFIDPECDQIRQIEDPAKPFEYHIYGKSSSMDMHRQNERLNRRRGEAVHECMRQVALARLAALDLHPMRLPATDGSLKHVQILMSAGLENAKRIILLTPDSESSGLGIHSFRLMVDTHVGNGSMETFVKGAQTAGYDGIVIANPATLLWDKSAGTAITNHTWKARGLSAKVSFSGAILDSKEHVIPGHETPEAHIASVLGYLEERLPEDAEVDFVATGYSSYALLQCLSLRYEQWQKHMHAGVLAESGHSIDDFTTSGLREFVRKRCRNYVLHADPLGTYIEPNLQTAVATFSSGATATAAEVVPAILSQVFGYFKKAWELDEKKKEKGNSPAGEEGYDDSDEEELNPLIPIIMGGEFGSAHQEWMDALRKLNLGEEMPGWMVPGAEEVEELKKRVEEQEVVFEQWKAEARAQGKDLHVYEEN